MNRQRDEAVRRVEFARHASGTRSSARRPTVEFLEVRTLMATSVTASGFPFLLGKDGVAFADPVATFFDTSPTPRLSDFTATIDWGDATSSQGTITPNAPYDGTYVVTGSHAFDTRATPYVIDVTIRDSQGATQKASSSLTIPPGVLTTTVVPISPVPKEGVRFNALLATFTDSNPNPKPGSFSAEIFWGDGTSSAGFVLPNQKSFDVRGSHLYLAGDYNVDIYITEVGGGGTEAHSFISVKTASITAKGLQNLAGVEGTPFTDPVATFTSANPLAVASKFRARIDWGGGVIDPVAIIRPSALAGSFEVSGSHAFDFGATQPISVTVQSTGGVESTVTSTINVSDAPLAVASNRVTAGVGQFGSLALGTLEDGAAAFSDAGDFTVTVDWGDGTGGPGRVVPTSASPSSYVVFGDAHAYLAAGSYTARATIREHATTVTITAPVTINPAALSATFAPFQVPEKSVFSGNVARFTSQNSLASANNFAATVNWGDGSSSPGTVTQTGEGFDVAGSHAYATSGNFTVRVAIASDEKVATLAQGVVTVEERLVPIEGGIVGGIGASNSNRPTYRGTSESSDIVTLTATRAGVGSPIFLGATRAAADGTWSITTVPLLDGSYKVTANAADSAGNPSTFPVTFPTLVVDTIAPRITGVSLNPKLGKVFITFQDDRSGLIDAALSNVTNYALSLPARKGSIPITGITISPGSGSDPRLVTLDFALGSAGRRLGARASRYTLSIAGHNFSDAAGNALSEQFYLSTPGAPKSGYIAQLVSNGNTTSLPQLVRANSAPKPSRFRRQR